MRDKVDNCAKDKYGINPDHRSGIRNCLLRGRDINMTYPSSPLPFTAAGDSYYALMEILHRRLPKRKTLVFSKFCVYNISGEVI